MSSQSSAPHVRAQTDDRRADPDATTEIVAARPPRDRWNHLLLAAAQGDEPSFTTLCAEAKSVLFLHALRVVCDPAEAEDVAQEALLDAWRSSGRFDPAKGQAATWLLNIARYRAIDRIRRSSARKANETRALLSVAPADVDSTVESVLLLDDHATVRSALDRLTDLQREAIRLVYYEGLSMREAADRLAVPVPTMKTRVRDAVIRLRTDGGFAPHD